MALSDAEWGMIATKLRNGMPIRRVADLHAIAPSTIVRRRASDPAFKRDSTPVPDAEETAKLRAERQRRRKSPPVSGPKLAPSGAEFVAPPEPTPVTPASNPTRDEHGYRIRPEPPRRRSRPLRPIFLGSPGSSGAFAVGRTTFDRADPPSDWLDARDRRVTVFGPGLKGPAMLVDPRASDLYPDQAARPGETTRLQALLAHGNEIRDADRRRLVREGLLRP